MSITKEKDNRLTAKKNWLNNCNEIVNICNVCLLNRVYSDPTTQDIETLETCMLVDEFQQDLKSMEHYKMALERVLNKCPQLNLYSKKFVVPLPADWPGWYYPKKLIASGWNPNISIIPEQGPFHVCLNAYEDVLLNFKFFLTNWFRMFLEVLWHRNPNHTRHPCVLLLPYLVGNWYDKRYWKSLESASNMNLSPFYTCLNMFCPLCSTSITFSEVVT